MKINKSFYILLLFLCLTAFSNLKAQTTSADLWLGTSFKYELIKDLDLKVELGNRRINYYSTRLYGDLILKYKLNNYLKFGIGWRHAGEGGEPLNVDELTDRFNFDLSGKLKEKDFSLKYRLRYQRKYSNWWTEQDGYIPNETIRTRLLLDYRLNKKVNFDIGFESFLAISEQEPMFIDKLRYMTGLEYRINKRQDIGVHYIRQQEVQVANPHTSHILSIDYSIDIKGVIKKIKKKKKKRDSSKNGNE